MKACRVEISSELFIRLIGLDDTTDLNISEARVDVARGIISLVLSGEHDDLPLVKEGEEIPQARIIASRVESRIEVI